MVHCWLAGIHPFSDGNGRTARILASLAMYRRDYKLLEFTSLEEWWGGHVADHGQALDCLGSEWAGEVDARVAHALYDAFFGREVTNRFYRSLADVSAATAVNDLARLQPKAD
jgi:hypothetical protein